MCWYHFEFITTSLARLEFIQHFSFFSSFFFFLLVIFQFSFNSAKVVVHGFVEVSVVADATPIAVNFAVANFDFGFAAVATLVVHAICWVVVLLIFALLPHKRLLHFTFTVLHSKFLFDGGSLVDEQFPKE